MRDQRVLLAFALLVASLPVGAKPAIRVVDTPQPLEIRSRVGGSPSARFIFETKDVTEIRLERSEFVDAASGKTVAPSKFTMTAETAVKNGTRFPYIVAISDLRDAGTFVGTFRAYSKESQTALARVDVRVVVEPMVTVAAAPARALRFAACTSQSDSPFTRVDCALIRATLPPAAAPGTKSITFASLVNSAGTPVRISGVHLSALGATNGAPLPSEALMIPLPIAGSQATIDVPATFTLGSIPPDRYTGTAYLTVSGVDVPVAVPIDIAVRRGPLLPFFILLLSVIGGWLVKFAETKGSRQAALLRRADGVGYRLSAADMAVLTPMLDEVRTLIYRFQLDEADQALDAVEGRARILRRLDDLEAELKGSAADPAVQAILQQFGPARKLVRLQLDTAADQALQNILTAIGALSAPAQQKVSPQLRALQRETARAQRGARGETLRTRLGDWFAAVRGEAVRWILLPVLYVALLASLVWIGFQVLYVQNVSFGANRLADYLSLVFWGISSDVASKALSGVRTLWAR